jgi:O-methyltransferase involved in polyketide biosynthesis
MYDFYLGGTNHHQIDSKTAATVAKIWPDISAMCKENRRFLTKVVRYMVEQGIAQFIDIGCGYPFQTNTHQIAQLVNPDAKVAYVDMDPGVISCWKHRVDRTTVIITGDIRTPHEVFHSLELRQLIDFSKPVGVLMMSVACFLTDAQITSTSDIIRSTVASGSYLAATHDTSDDKDAVLVQKVQEIYNQTQAPLYFRSQEQVAPIFRGFGLIEPGLTFLDEWLQEEGKTNAHSARWLYGGIGRKSGDD